jgi:hypothetical protein
LRPSPKDFGYPSLRCLFGFLLILFSFVFWKLDERAKLLIKNAEAALKHLEEQDATDIRVTHVFRREEVLTRDAKASKIHLSYAKCFNMVFLVFAFLGIGTLLWQLWGLVHC